MSTAIESPARAAAAHSGRDRILEASILVFGTYGFAKTTIQDITERAQVSKPLFYRQFRNKQDVFEAVVERVFTDWREALVEELNHAPANTRSALRVLFVGALEYARRRPFLARLLTRDAQLSLSSGSEVWDRACHALRELIREILERGAASGDVRGDQPIEVMADLLTETHFAFANRQLQSGEPIGPERAEALIACLLDGVLSEGA